MSPQLKAAMEAFVASVKNPPGGGKSPVFLGDFSFGPVMLKDPDKEIVDNLVFHVLKARQSGCSRIFQVMKTRHSPEHNAIKQAVDDFKGLLDEARSEYPEEVCGDVAKELLDLQHKLADEFEVNFKAGVEAIRAAADKKIAKAVYENDVEEWKSARDQYVADHTVAGLASVSVTAPNRIQLAIEQVSQVFEALHPKPVNPFPEEQDDEVSPPKDQC